MACSTPVSRCRHSCASSLLSAAPSTVACTRTAIRGSPWNLCDRWWRKFRSHRLGRIPRAEPVVLMGRSWVIHFHRCSEHRHGWSSPKFPKDVEQRRWHARTSVRVIGSKYRSLRGATRRPDARWSARASAKKAGADRRREGEVGEARGFGRASQSRSERRAQTVVTSA